MDYDVQEINAFDEFVGIENEWNTLLSNSHCNIPQLRHEWFRIWWSHFGQQNKMVVILIRANGSLVFAISLMEVRRSFFGLPFIVLESMTNYHSGRYSFLMENGEDKAQSVFFQYLHSRLDTWHMLQLQSVLDDINAHESFINNARSKKLNVIMAGFALNDAAKCHRPVVAARIRRHGNHGGNFQCAGHRHDIISGAGSFQFGFGASKKFIGQRTVKTRLRLPMKRSLLKKP